MKRLIYVLALLVIDNFDANAQECRLAEGQVRQLAAEAFASTRTDYREFTKTFDRSVKRLAPNVETGPTIIFASEGLGIWLQSPYTLYRDKAIDAVRKMEPLDDVPWLPAFTISVAPTQIDAADIEKIMVQREGQNIQPAESGLALQELTTRMGAKVKIHAGTVTFPCSAFAPGGTVTVIAIPSSSVGNITKVLKPEKLATLW